MQTSELLEKLQKHLNIQWIYEQKQTKADEVRLGQQQLSLEIIPPSAKELNQLYELALKGRIKKIQQRIKELEKNDPTLTNFAMEIDKYTKSFQIEKIQAFIKKYMG